MIIREGVKKALETLKEPFTALPKDGGEFIFSYEAKDIQNVISIIEEAMKPKTCEGCKYFRKSDKACFMSSQNTYIRPASIDFSGCSKHEPKDNA